MFGKKTFGRKQVGMRAPSAAPSQQPQPAPQPQAAPAHQPTPQPTPQPTAQPSPQPAAEMPAEPMPAMAYASAEAQSDFPQPYVEDDGKMRVFPKAIFEGEHGQMLRDLGFDPDDERNIIPQADDFDRMVQESLARQEERRCALEARLLEQHGHNQIRPFFICGEGVMNTKIGNWLIKGMKLMPYDEWNVAYLPMDEATAAVMGLPLHPQQSIAPIDELIVERLRPLMDNVEVRRAQSKHAMVEGYNPQEAERFVTYIDEQRNAIIDYVSQLRPKVIALIGEVQSGGI